MDAATIRHWISIPEASFLLLKLPRYFDNFGKRIIESSKYYFTDVGMLCYLMGTLRAQNRNSEPSKISKNF